MDSKQDFLNPALIHYLFFRQKNLIIYPYIDLKHLMEGMEPYSVGHTLVDLDMTAIFDLELVLGSQDSYTERPNLYLLHNCSEQQLEQILAMKTLRCIININQKIDQKIIDGHNYILYNKKQKKLIAERPENLTFEKTLIKNAEKTTALHNELQKLFIEATSIFEYISQGEDEEIRDILVKYRPHIREKLLQFIERYFKITVPEKEQLLQSLPDKPAKKRKKAKKGKKTKKGKNEKTITKTFYPASESKAKFLKEYNRIMNHANIGREFIQLLHKYKTEHVNQSNLEMDQLINPSKLYAYLRMHHWKKEIPPEFVKNWVQMKNTEGALKEETKSELKELLADLNIPITEDLEGILKATETPAEHPEKNAKSEQWIEKSQPLTTSATQNTRQAVLVKDPGNGNQHQHLIRENPHRPPISDYRAYKTYVDELIRDVKFLMERVIDKHLK